MVFVHITIVATQAGIGTTLIRQKDPPEPGDLATLLGFQLVVATLLSAGIAGVGLMFGTAGHVTALLVAALPLLALRSPANVVLERRLDYRWIVYADVAETVVYFGWATTTALLGWGVWALASAVLPRALAGTVVLLAATREGRILPRVSLARLRRMLAFGSRVQGVDFVYLGRDQGLNVGIAWISGTVELGVWSLAFRIMQIPYILVSTLVRVSLPAISRLIHAGEDVSRSLERAVSLTALVAGATLAPFVAALPLLVPAVLGESWNAVAEVLPWACLGLVVSGPISVAAAGYLYAIGDATTPLRAAVAHAVMWLATTFALLDLVGIRAAGIGWLVGAIVDAAILGRGVARTSSARVLRPLLWPTTLAIVGAGAGYLLPGSGILGAVGAAVTAEAVFLLGIALFARDRLRDLLRLIGEAVGLARLGQAGAV
jgi:O-antigen/teichoic acid export membrane protein